MDNIHNLLKRQLRKYLNGPLADQIELQPFLLAVNQAYCDSDSDLHMLERAMDLSSNELQRANTQLRAIFQAFPDLLYRFDKHSRIIDCKGTRSIAPHLQPEELIGKYARDIPNKDVAEKFQNAIQEVQKTGSMVVIEYSLIYEGGKSFFEGRFTPLLEENTIAIIRDVTVRKNAELALLESERTLTDIIEFLPDATVVLDIEGRVIAWNRAMENLTSTKAEDILGKGNYEHAIPFYGERRPILVDLVLKSSAETEGEYSAFQREGNILIAEAFIKEFQSEGAFIWGQASPLYDSSGRVIGAIETIRDITEFKHAEKKLRDSGERLKRQQEMLVALAKSKNLVLSDLNVAIHEITEAAATTLDVTAVSVWFFNKDHTKLICSDHYDRKTDRHSEGMELKADQLEIYTKALAEHRVIAASDVSLDPRLTELVANYLIPKGITSLLDVPIFLGGNTVGVVSHEHYGRPRQWAADEESFSSSIADIISLAIDATERKKIEDNLRIRTTAMNATTDQISIIDRDGKIEFVNPSFENELGYSLSELEGRPIKMYMASGDDEEFCAALENTVLAGEPWQGEILAVKKDGTTVLEELTLTPVKNDAGKIERLIGIQRNVTQKKLYEQQLDHLAHHDSLTGLPNRLLFNDRLIQCLANAARNKTMVAILFLDLDRFKFINDTLGHSVGDLLLQSVSERLQGCIRDADTLARMGGDEFTIILSNISNIEAIETITRRAVDAISAPFKLANRELFVTVSIGVSLYPADGTDAETLIKNADTAMYRAKEQGRNNYQFYTKSLNVAALTRMQLEGDLRRAVERNEFVLHYQPIVAIHNGQILGAEALIRWQHPERGLIPPAQFITLAEETGLIMPISDWVLQSACAQNKDWQDKGLPPISVAVNVSARHFRNDGLVPAVQNALAVTGLSPKYLELEITEGVLMDSMDSVVDILNSLKNINLRLSIDDFGTGYSSLTCLKQFPINAVKIDQSFIRDLATNADDAAIAHAVIAMAQSLKRSVVAEGVETFEQFQLLQSLGCDEIQGYLISRPLPADDFERLLRKYMTLPNGIYDIPISS